MSTKMPWSSSSTDPCCCQEPPECCMYPASDLQAGRYYSSDLPNAVTINWAGHPSGNANRSGDTFGVGNTTLKRSESGNLWILEDSSDPANVVRRTVGNCLITGDGNKTPGNDLVEDQFSGAYVINVEELGNVTVYRESLCWWRGYKEVYNEIFGWEGYLFDPNCPDNNKPRTLLFTLFYENHNDILDPYQGPLWHIVCENSDVVVGPSRKTPEGVWGGVYVLVHLQGWWYTHYTWHNQTPDDPRESGWYSSTGEIFSTSWEWGAVQGCVEGGYMEDGAFVFAGGTAAGYLHINSVDPL